MLNRRSVRNAAGVAAMMIMGAGMSAHAQSVEPQRFPGYMSFEGRYLAVLSDADMVASAYMAPPLGPRSEAMRDELALFPLEDGMPGEPVRIPVSNAVTAWPSLLAFTVDGRTAYVAETELPAEPGMTSHRDLVPSPMVRVVAIGDDLAGEVVQEIDTGGRAIAASVRPQGDVLAVSVTRTGTPQVALLPIEADGRLGELRTVLLEGAEADPPHIEWSPDGTLFAITMAGADAVRFYRYDGETLAPHGDVVGTGKLPGPGHWSPDGAHFFVTHLHWGGDTEDVYVGSEISTLAAIRVAPAGASEPVHLMVSTVATGASAEEFAIAPDGRTLVTLNMERSFLMPEDPRLTYHSSLTLVSWDPERERLHVRDTYPFEGILPEGITFDCSGRFLAVANFAHSNPRRPVEETTVDFWRLVDGPVPMLAPMDLELPVMRGAHVVKVVG